ncbi:MAG: hypothetical protein QF797_15955 [Alphaproteobacteria bacterium]|jgi:hypothetical protein|nr:hypothetical protein [Alphaproteobacteria bacterium]MDP6621729.1 hypothetical protein [Alphaproteobacteria bacterium]|tara:strand:- start:489 stop:1094 length:606 start_codon:yes stop_codon:yes gene_type:complete
MPRVRIIVLVILTGWLLPVEFAAAHHVLGRPSYSLSEDSNTPPAVQVEVEVGEFSVTYMVFPDVPRPGRPGRLNLYLRQGDGGSPFDGKVTFKVRDDSWLSWLGYRSHESVLGVQSPDDNVFRQGVHFEAAGEYIVSVEFEAGGRPYAIDFPLRVGEPSRIGPISIAVAVLVIALAGFTVIQRRRSLTGKIRGAHNEKQPK